MYELPVDFSLCDISCLTNPSLNSRYLADNCHIVDIAEIYQKFNMCYQVIEIYFLPMN